jgi:hypothetical protein
MSNAELPDQITHRCGHVVDVPAGFEYLHGGDVELARRGLARLAEHGCKECEPAYYRPIAPGPSVYTDPNGGRVEIWDKS